MTYIPHRRPLFSLHEAPQVSAEAISRDFGRALKRENDTTPHFLGLVLGCIEADFCKQIFVGKLLTRSTRCTYFCTAQTSIFQKCFAYGSYILVPSFPSSLPPGSLLPFGPPGFFCGSGFCAAAPSRPPRSPAPPPHTRRTRYDTLKFPLRGRAIRDSEPLSKFDNLHFQHLPREKKLLIAGHPTFFAPGPSSRMLSFELLCGYTYALLFDLKT